MSEGAIVDRPTENAASKPFEFYRPTRWLAAVVAVVLALGLATAFIAPLAAYAKSPNAANG